MNSWPSSRPRYSWRVSSRPGRAGGALRGPGTFVSQVRHSRRELAAPPRPSHPWGPGPPPSGAEPGGPRECRPNHRRDSMKKEMLINVLQPEECRIAILEDGVLEELYVERTSHE